MTLRKPLRIFNISTFLQTQILMLPVMLLFYEENGLTAGDLFLFQGIFSITALLFEIPAGYIGDIFPRRNVLIFSYLLFLMRLILWYFFRGYWIVLAGEILFSMSKAFYSGVSDGYIYDYLKSKGKTKKMLSGYGKLNFWMSLGTAMASLVGPFLYKAYGFPVLILIEIVLNTGATLLLFLLPSVPAFHHKTKGLRAKYHELYTITKDTLSNPQLCHYIMYSGIIAATTMVFVWSFQPLMQISMIPVTLFGVIYFINHFCRAGAALFLQQTVKWLSLKTIGKLTYIFFILSFMASVVVIEVANPIVGMILLTFICIAIGMQLTFTLGSTALLHTLVSSETRSTASSVKNLVSRFMAGVMLIMFKFVLDGITLEQSFIVYMIAFALSIVPLYKLLKLPTERASQKESVC